MRVRLLSVNLAEEKVIIEISTVNMRTQTFDLHFIYFKSHKIKYLTLDLRKWRKQIKCDKILKNIDVILNSNETRF